MKQKATNIQIFLPQPVESLELTAADAPVWKGIMILYCILIAILYRHLLLFSLNLKYFCYYQFSLFCICKVCPTCAHSLAFCGVNSDLFLPKFFVFSVCIYIFVFIFFLFLLVFIFGNCNASPTCAHFVACWEVSSDSLFLSFLFSICI